LTNKDDFALMLEKEGGVISMKMSYAIYDMFADTKNSPADNECGSVLVRKK
jgi:hypothetical protein